MSDHDQHVAHLRSVRDIALSESDFSQLPDVLSAEDKALWATYRQELRDFPSTFPDEITSHPKKSHMVKASENGKEKIIRFGQQGVKGAGKSPSTEAEKKRRASFKARHESNIKKGKMSAAYWADKVKW